MKTGSGFSVKRLIHSILFNTAVLAVALLVFRPFFEEIDDTHISMILEGAFGTREPHTIFTNTLLGWIIVFLQGIVPNVRWFIVLQYAFIYIGYVIAVYAISKHKRGLPMSVVFVLATFYEMYVSVQYTKTTAFVCVAGFVALFEYVRDVDVFDKRDRLSVYEVDESLIAERRMFLIIGWILMFYGIILRRDGLFLAAVPAVAAGIIELLRTKNIKRYVIAFVPVGVMFVMLHFLNLYTYTSNPDWSNVLEYNRARTVLNDQRCDALDYVTHGDELAAMGVSENDAIMLLTYQFGDDNVFSYERMNEIGNSFAPKKVNYMTFANLFENLVNEMKKSYIMVAGLIGLIIMLIAAIVTDRSKSSPGYIRDARYKVIAMVLMGLICAAALIYFQYMGRYSHRLFAAIVIPTMLTICYIVDGIRLRDNDSRIVFGGNKSDITVTAVILTSVVIIALNANGYFANMSDYAAWKVESEPTLYALDEMVRDTDSYYVADTFTFQNVHKYELFTVYEENYFANFVTCGSWFLNTPITKTTMAKYGYANPFEALRDTERDVYLCDNLWLESKVTFLNEHYDGEYEAEEVDSRGGVKIYIIKGKGTQPE